jgi:hypothetical protein
VVHIISHRYRDPAALVAAEVGMRPRRTIETDDGGNYPQSLLNRACNEIQRGASDAWLIGGAESWRTKTAAKRAGDVLPWTVQDDSVTPTERIDNPEPLAHPGEWARRIFLPIEIYPLFENALRAAEGWTIDEHRDRIARLYSRFSEIAADNPHAWIRRPFTPAELREATPDNRMVGFPYTKLMNANNAVEQAACFVVTSVERARALGIARDRWVFPWSRREAHEHWWVSNRWSLAEAPAIRHRRTGGARPRRRRHRRPQPHRRVLVLPERRADRCEGDRPQHRPRPHRHRWAVVRWRPLEQLRQPRHRHHGGAPARRPGQPRPRHRQRRVPHQARVRRLQHQPPPEPWRHADLQPQVDALPRRELAEAMDPEVVVETSVVMHDRDERRRTGPSWPGCCRTAGGCGAPPPTRPPWPGSPPRRPLGRPGASTPGRFSYS